MLAAPFARWLAARGIHYGWVMVAITFAYALASTAAMAIPGVLMVPMGQELHWSIGEISSPLALRLFLFGAIAPISRKSCTRPFPTFPAFARRCQTLPSSRSRRRARIVSTVSSGAAYPSE